VNVYRREGKWALDVVVAASALLVFSPLFVVVDALTLVKGARHTRDGSTTRPGSHVG
jgi:lipopolysaccharide/colanic/teichoic acid biosynthesis glycosyltransferase